MSATIEYNPFDPSFRANPYPHYAELVSGPPRHLSLGAPVVLVARYSDVLAVTRDHGSFSSTLPQYAVSRGANPFGGAVTLPFADPPVHTRLRRLVASDFTPRRIGNLAPRIAEITKQLLQGKVGGGRFEAMSALANQVPVMIIAEMLGIPSEEHQQFKEWSEAVATNDFTGNPAGPAMRESVRQLREYLAAAIECRRRAPGADLISALVAAHDQSDALTADELLAFVVLLLVAGNETTTNLIGNGLLALARNPNEYQRLRREPALISTAVEKMLRYDSPVQALMRFAIRDLEVGGVPIKPGSIVAVLFAAANRDPEQFPEPDRFDSSRSPNHHLAFGDGIHFCLGAPLARLEAGVVFREIVERFDRIALADPTAPLAYRGSVATRGLRELNLVLG
ncbi:MAG TPA: cytochrome P450 [Candidatus Binataceae bacterium]|nr:cytochrome P450 [Candidatus Binataceae bacterium]